MSDAHDAKVILDNPTFQKAVKEYSDQLVQVWSTSEKLEQREAAWNQQRALTAVINHLAGFIDKEEYNIAKRGKLK